MSDEETEQLRKELKKLLEEALTQLIALDRDSEDHLAVTSWAIAYEYSSVELERAGSYRTGVMMASDQTSATSRGLLSNGADWFSPLNGN